MCRILVCVKLIKNTLNRKDIRRQTSRGQHQLSVVNKGDTGESPTDLSTMSLYNANYISLSRTRLSGGIYRLRRRVLYYN